MNNAVGFETLSPAMAQVSNYFNWIFDAMEPHMGKRILEVGPGFGNLGERLIRSSRAYYAVDSDEKVIDTLKRRLRLGPADRAVAGNIADPRMIQEVEEWRPDTVISMNVLEHVEQDRALYSALVRFPTIKHIIVFVPAIQFLYGTMDQQAGHYRRYSRSGLTDLMIQAGAKDLKVRYFNGLGAFAWFTAGRVLKLQMNSEKTNTSITGFDRYIIPVARFVDPALSLFLGQSLMAFANNGRFNPNPISRSSSSI